MLTVTPFTLRIAHAYELKDYQLEGGPDWLTSARFELKAKAAGDATDAQVREMLQTLLTERFRCKCASTHDR